MATFPYFVLGPSTLLSAWGLFRGGDKVPATPRDDWRAAAVDVVIPALNEAAHIPLCLASLMQQTVRPRRIILVDDGSTDGTVDVAEAFCRLHDVPLTAIRRRAPIGKTPTLKRQARESDADVEFILDADTILESPDYIARTVEELYKGVGIASACGTVLPLRRRDRRRWLDRPELELFARRFPKFPLPQDHPVRDLARGITNLYREVLYLFLQRFIYQGQHVFLGTMANPVGCAVAYRRLYVKELFEHFNPLLGDDLTNSEDIFIGLAMLDSGYRNVRVADVQARTVEPEVQRLPRQIYLWSSAFLQSCYYFDPLLRSPFKAMRRQLERQRRPRAQPVSTPVALAGASVGSTMNAALMSQTLIARPASLPPAMRPGADTMTGTSSYERRQVSEPYRQAFGRARTLENGRPAGWMLLMGAVEKVFFPASLIIMIILASWEALLVTVGAETTIGVAALVAVTKGQRLQYLLKGIAVAPLRYALMLSEVYTIGRFAVDVWIRRDRRWRK